MATMVAFADSSVVTDLFEMVSGTEPAGFFGKFLGLTDKLQGLLSLGASVGPLDMARIVKTVKEQMEIPVESLATEHFFSRAPFQIGEAAVKYQLTPDQAKSSEPEAFSKYSISTPSPLDPSPPSNEMLRSTETTVEPKPFEVFSITTSV